MKHRNSSLLAILGVAVLACSGVKDSTTAMSATDASGSGGADSGGPDIDPTGGAADQQPGTGGSFGSYECPGVLGGSGTFGDVGSAMGGVGSSLSCVVGKEYCEFQAYAGESGQAPGGVPFCLGLTGSLAACAGTPDCACVCSLGHVCGELCSCTDVGGLAVVYCEGI